MNCKILLLLVIFGTLAYVQAQLLSNEVPCNEKKIIVDTHNELRKKIANGEVPNQPRAGNLQKIVWDDQLALLAQNYANNMNFNHNPNRKDERFYVGENLFYYWSSHPIRSQMWRVVIEAFFNEHKKYTYRPLVSDPGTGHYTQVVWADTMYVGCGIAYYPEGHGYTQLYVCNYGPGGNYLGQYPYIIGNDCKDLCCENQCSMLYGEKCQDLI